MFITTTKNVINKNLCNTAQNKELKLKVISVPNYCAMNCGTEAVPEVLVPALVKLKSVCLLRPSSLLPCLAHNHLS